MKRVELRSAPQPDELRTVRRDGSLQLLEGLISRSQACVDQGDLERDDVRWPGGFLKVTEELLGLLRAAGDGAGVAQEALPQRE